MEFTTRISQEGEGGHSIYGQEVLRLMKEKSFTEVIFLLFAGKLPTPGEKILLDAMLIAASEHGVEVPSLYAPRVSVASGNPVHVGLAAGMLAMGDAHGCAGEAAAALLSEADTAEAIVHRVVSEGRRIPGFGHKIYSDQDPRASVLYEVAKEQLLPLQSFEKAYAMESALEHIKGKKFPLNIDGAFAAGVLSLGLPPSATNALFALARVAGMGAHALEELEQKNGYRRFS